MFPRAAHGAALAPGRWEAWHEATVGVRAALEEGENVKLSGFGNFELRTKSERPGRNPKTGEEIPIKARRVVTFHSSQKLKNSVEEKTAGKQS